MPCGNSTLGLSTDLSDCECASGSALFETDIVGGKLSSKECISCPAGTSVVTTSGLIAGRYYTADRYSCQSCPDPHMTMSEAGGVYTCACDTGYTLVGVSGIGEQSCLLDNLVEPFLDRVNRARRVEYYDPDVAGTENSLVVEHYFLAAAARCTYYGRPEDVQYCHQLANLCALHLFNDQSEPCLVHLEMIDERSGKPTNKIANWPARSPWLYYSGLGNDACTSDIHRSRVTFQDYLSPYVLVSYYMNGTLRGIDDLETTLAYCTRAAPETREGGGEGSDTRWQLFGYNHQTNYTCDLQNLFNNGGEQFFYEPYMWHTDKDYYSPMPVRIVNMRSTIFDSIPEKKPNKRVPSLPLCDINDVLVRRFFLFDKLSGVTKLPRNALADLEPKIVRYASYISIEASLVGPAKIYPPVITIEYTELDTSTFTGEETKGTIEFSSYYTMDMTVFYTNFSALFITVMVFTGLFFALRFYNWKVRNSRVMTEQKLSTDLGAFNFGTVFELCLIIMSTWNYVFFWFTLCVCWYFFAFYKVPIVPTILLPRQIDFYSFGSPYYMFIVNVHVMACFQLVLVLVMCWRQARADIFFIDWEPQRAKTDAAANSKKSSSSANVSVWRTILVANEWAELQTIRKTDIRLTLILLMFVLIGLGEDNNATFQPDSANKGTWDMSIVLRYGNTGFFWLLLSYAQYLWKFFIAERYLGEPPERLFIDFCTIAKISVIVLDEQYHGYYLHCRSPHQYADGTMSELVQMLHKEEAGLTTDRSLEGAPPGVQSFQIFLSSDFRQAFDKIKTNLVGAETMTELIQQGRNRTLARAARGAAGGRAGSNTNAAAAAANARTRGVSFRNNAPSERTLKAWKEMMVFLQEFVENNFGKPGLRRTVREPTYWEKFSSGAPDLSATDQPCVFFTDREFQYTKAMFLGRETELLMLNIMVYGLVNLWTGSSTTAAFLTYLLELGIVQFRHSIGEVCKPACLVMDAMPCHVLLFPCPVMSCLALSYPVMPCPASVESISTMLVALKPFLFIVLMPSWYFLLIL